MRGLNAESRAVHRPPPNRLPGRTRDRSLPVPIRFAMALRALPGPTPMPMPMPALAKREAPSARPPASARMAGTDRPRPSHLLGGSRCPRSSSPIRSAPALRGLAELPPRAARLVAPSTPASNAHTAGTVRARRNHPIRGRRYPLPAPIRFTAMQGATAWPTPARTALLKAPPSPTPNGYPAMARLHLDHLLRASRHSPFPPRIPLTAMSRPDGGSTPARTAPPSRMPNASWMSILRPPPHRTLRRTLYLPAPIRFTAMP
jgi:hypothetical protein